MQARWTWFVSMALRSGHAQQCLEGIDAFGCSSHRGCEDPGIA